MKFCKDCKWARIGLFDWLFMGGYEYAQCHHPEIGVKISDKARNVVTGKELPSVKSWWYCNSNRMFGPCFEEAKYWEKK